MDDNTGNITSGFNAAEIDAAAGFDFNRAEPLNRSGSTCDAFKATFHRRKVFIKKLKTEHEHNPLYRAAFAKEYETGAMLSHPSLPVYTEFFDTYMVMNYVDGPTLSSMIAGRHPWLRNTRNVRRMLLQLLDAVDYLHSNNVIHCDIKPDNIIIVHNTRNPVLLDLDKCHTDWLDNTSGRPALYGVSDDDPGNPDIDFHGLGMIAKQLCDEIPALNHNAFSRFTAACFRTRITADELRRALTPSPLKKWLVPAVTATAIAALAIALTVTRNSSGNTGDTPVTQTAASSAAPDLSANINESMAQRLEPLYSAIAEAEKIADNPHSSDADLIDCQMKLIEKQGQIFTETIEYYKTQHPDATQAEIELAVATSPLYSEYLARAEKLSKKIADVINRRH